MIVAGSVGVTPYSSAVIPRLSANAMTSPSATPAATGHMASRSIIFMMLFRLAPMASRKPISRVRCAVEKLSSP